MSGIDHTVSAANDSQPLDTTSDTIMKIFLQPVQKKETDDKQTGRLDAMVFCAPAPSVLSRAAAYRLSSAPAAPRISRVSLHSTAGKMVRRQKTMRAFLKKEVVEGFPLNPPGAGRPMSTCSMLTDEPITPYVDLDFDFEESEEDEVFKLDVPRDLQENRLTYRRACRKLGLVPAASFLRGVGQEVMRLAHMSLTATGVKACVIALLNNIHVKRLDLTGNDMGLEGARHVSGLIRESDYLTELILAENNLTNEGCRLIADEMQLNDRIHMLDLSGNKLTETGATYIADMLDENRTLKQLNLSHNELREKGGQILEDALVSNDALEVLDLSWNHLRQKGAIAIANGLALNTGLKVLRLGWNGFYEGGCQALAAALGTNSCLQELDLAANRINVACLRRLGKGLLENQTLQVLKIGENPLSTQGAIMLLKVLEENVNLPLEVLDITGQCVDDKFLRLLSELRDQRPLQVKHGVILRQFGAGGKGGDVFISEDPMMVLMEYMRIMNLRLVDLFTSLDKDGSKTLTRDEFKTGLLAVNIPLEEKALDRLISKLDKDKDGEVDFGELIEGQKEHKKKLHRMKKREVDVPFEETEIGRINVKLRELMAIRENMFKHRLRMLKAVSAVAGLGRGTSSPSPGGLHPGSASRRGSLLGSRPGSGLLLSRRGSSQSSRPDSALSGSSQGKLEVEMTGRSSRRGSSQDLASPRSLEYFG